MLPPVAKINGKWCKSDTANGSKRSRAPICLDVFCDEGYFTLAESAEILKAGVKLGLKPRIHADEFVSLGATRLAVDLQAASADHLLKITDQDIAYLAESNTAAVLLPGTSFYLNLTEHAPARRLIDRGVIVALGSDFNPGSCHIYSLPLIMGLACLKLKMTPAEALNATTINAAHALGLGGKVGQIREGYQADITVYDVPRLEEIAYNIGSNVVRQTVKKGRLVYGGTNIATN
jgi:imidazolonepropionase